MLNYKRNVTMKKTYINPSMEVIRIASQSQMLAGSPTQQLYNQDATGTGLGHGMDDDWEDDEDF